MTLRYINPFNRFKQPISSLIDFIVQINGCERLQHTNISHIVSVIKFSLYTGLHFETSNDCDPPRIDKMCKENSESPKDMKEQISLRR